MAKLSQSIEMDGIRVSLHVELSAEASARLSGDSTGDEAEEARAYLLFQLCQGMPALLLAARQGVCQSLAQTSVSLLKQSVARMKKGDG